MSVASFSSAQVLALAPDPASAKAGASLAVARKWSSVAGAADGRALWGECQGSGAQPYRTQIDLADLASRCSCPSRKFPCKHALGLLLLFAAEPELFPAATPPAWVVEWLDGRAERSERSERQRHRESAAGPPSAAQESDVARRRRETARADRIAAGLVELARWLEDLVRGGLSSAAARPAAFWDTAAARLVDAQAPGAARLVRQLAAIPTSGADWPERMLAAAARLHLLTEAYARLGDLPADAQADVRAALGWSPAVDDVAPTPAAADAWLVVGQIIEEDDRLRARRTWLVGRGSGRHALLLHFAHGTSAFAEAVPPPGSTLDAELAFFPGSSSLRATLRPGDTSRAPTSAVGLPAGHARLADATRGWAAALAANPWTERVLVVLSEAVPERRGDAWVVRDADGDALPIAPRFRAVWPLMALAGGRPVWLCAEWDGERLLPLAAAADGTIVSLASSAGVPA